MTTDTQPTAFGDLTQPHHVPTCVSTGEGITVPTPAPTPRTMEQIAQECAEKVCHEGCLLDRGVACELIATAIAQAVEQKDCKIANQAERIRYLEGATNHATGTPLSKAKAECAQAQAALAAKDAEIARRKAQLDMWTSAAMDGNAVIAQLTARAEKAEAELARLKAQDEFHWNIIKGCMEELEMVDMGPSMIRGEIQEWKCSHERLKAKEVAATDRAVLLAAERDALRAEVEHIKAWANAKCDEVVELERNLYTGDDDEKKTLRAEVEQLKAQAGRYEQRLAEARRERDTAEAALAAAQATAREAMEEADHYKRIFKSNGASMELMASRIPTGGQVIDAVIRAAAVTADSPGVLVWSANAAEQIEAALAKIAEEGQPQP